jgi:hypothetical protein
MSEHLSSEQAERFHKRLSPPGEILSIYNHLAACEECRRLLAARQQPEASLAFVLADLEGVAAETDHLSYEQIAAYVDDEADGADREIIETHLEACAACEAEVKELSAFKAGAATQGASGSWGRFVTFWQAPGYRVPLQAAAMLALAFLSAWIATRSLRSERDGLNVQIAELQKRNQELEQNYEEAASRAEELEALQQQVQAGRQVVPDGAQAMVTLNDGGGVITIDASGRISNRPSLPSGYREDVSKAMSTGEVKPPPLVATLIGSPAGSARGPSDGAAFALRSPVGTFVESDRPALRWKVLPGAASYTVIVYDAGFNEVAKSQPLSTTEWTVPRPLERDRVYIWQVTAIKGGREIKSPSAPAPEAKFKVLDQKSSDEIEKSKRAYAGSRLILGIIYTKAGLLDEAEREFTLLARANPESKTAQKLLANLRRLRRSR